MDFVGGGYPLCKFFTKTFKNNNNVSPNDIADLTTSIQKTVGSIHSKDFLIVDLNEMNIMIDDKFKVPVFLDVDSYQTPSFPATALMESIRDSLVKKNNFTQESDWYAWAIITFQMYVGLHPYKGKHPDYKPKDWRKRMDDGVSVFDSKATMPPSCNDFSVIPKRHLDWYRDIFLNNNRSVPPYADSTIPVAVTGRAVTIIRKSENFDTNEALRVPESIKRVYVDFGVIYSLTGKGVYKGTQKIWDESAIFGSSWHLVFVNNSPLLIVRDSMGIIHIKNPDGSLVDSAPADEVMYRDGRLYSIYANQVFEHHFDKMGLRIVHHKKRITQVIPNQSKVYEGLIMQRGAHRTIMAIPFDKGSCAVLVVPEINDCRIVDAKGEGNFVVVVTVKDGIYSRIIFKFNNDFSSYQIRRIDDIEMSEINFTVLPGGICILMPSDDKIEVFSDLEKLKEVDNPPFDSSMKLFSTTKGVHFIDEEHVFHTTMK